MDAFILALNKKKTIGEVINLGTGYEFSIKDVLNATSKILNKKIRIVSTKERFRPKKSEVNRLLSDNRKLKRYLDGNQNLLGKRVLKKQLN